jgi:hypothetical protein
MAGFRLIRQPPFNRREVDICGVTLGWNSLAEGLLRRRR